MSGLKETMIGFDSDSHMRLWRYLWILCDEWWDAKSWKNILRKWSASKRCQEDLRNERKKVQRYGRYFNDMEAISEL